MGAAVAAALVWLLATALTDDEGRDAVEADSNTTGQTTPTAQPTASEPAAPTTAAPTTAAPTPTPTPSAESPSASASPATATRLSSAITDYYALLPDDTARAWPLLTAAYQSRTAGGRDSYEGFWSEIDDVSVSDVEAAAPDRVVATVTYSRDNGQVDIERTSYRMVDEGGVLKITASEVLSSRRG
jgi:hypothetical protein